MDKQQGNLNALLHGLVKTAVATIDATKAEQQIITHLSKLIDCDHIFIFQLDQDQERFVAQNLQKEKNTDIQQLTINGVDSLAASLINNSNSLMRVNERKPIIPLVNAELFTPLTNSQETIGFLYFARMTSTPFSDDDIRKADFIAPIVSLVLEHQKSKHDLDTLMQQDESTDTQITQLKNNLQRVQTTTRGILQNLNFPTAIVDLNSNSITNVNKKFLSLLKMQAGDLASYSLTDLISETGSDEYSTQALLINADKEKIKMRLYKTLLDEKHPEKMLYLFMPVALQHEYSISEFISQFNNITMHPDIEAKIAEFISNEFDVKYTAFFKTAPRENLKLTAVYERGHDACLPSAKAEKFKQKIFEQILSTKNPLFFKSTDEQNYKAWQPVAEDMQYSSLCAFPLSVGQEVVGVMALFSARTVEWENLTRPLGTIAQILSPALKWQQREHLYEEQKEQVEAIIHFSQSINWSKEPRHIYEQIIVNLNRLIPFDYCSITQLDNKQEQRFEFTTMDFAQSAGQINNWEKIQHTRLGWATHLNEKVNNLAFTLPTNFSVLLMKNEKYVGNLAVARAQKKPFSEHEKSLLRHLSPIIAGIANIDTKNSVRAHDTEKLLNMLLNFQPETEHNILADLSAKIKNALNLDMVKIDMYRTDEPAQLFFNFLPGKVKKQLSTSKKTQFCKRMSQTKKAIIVHNVNEFNEYFMSQHQSFVLRPFIIAPIIQNNKMVAYLIAQMHESKLEAFADVAVPKIAKFTNYIIENELDQSAHTKLSAHDQETVKIVTGKMRELIRNLDKNYGEWLPEEPQQDMLTLLEQINQLESVILNRRHEYQLELRS